MSASLETTNYKLPIYTNQDTIAYIPDWNKAMRTIDTQMEMNEEKADGVASDAENLLNLYTALSSEVQTLTQMVNGLRQMPFPANNGSPTMNTRFYGVMTEEYATFDGTIYARSGYIEAGAIHFTHDFSGIAFEMVEIASIAGNPFNLTEPPTNPRHIGFFFGEAVNPTRVNNIDLINEYLYAAVQNNITHLYMALHEENLNKQIFLTMSGVIKR